MTLYISFHLCISKDDQIFNESAKWLNHPKTKLHKLFNSRGSSWSLQWENLIHLGRLIIFNCLLLLKYSASKTNSTRQRRTELAMNIKQKKYNSLSSIINIIVAVIFVPQHSCLWTWCFFLWSFLFYKVF